VMCCAMGELDIGAQEIAADARRLSPLVGIVHGHNDRLFAHQAPPALGRALLTISLRRSPP
jgi:hypothetical protein